MQRIGAASRYVGSRKTGMTATEDRLMLFAKNELKTALEKQNDFFENQWTKFVSEMEKIERNPFKETTLFTLD
jgi:hypothetical protein